jgi:hypothetical protein
MGCGWSNMVPTLVPRDRVSIGGRDHAIRNVSMCAAAGDRERIGGRRGFPGRLAACSGPREQLIDCATSLIA